MASEPVEPIGRLCLRCPVFARGRSDAVPKVPEGPSTRSFDLLALLALRAPGRVFSTQIGQMNAPDVLVGNQRHARAFAGIYWAALAGLEPAEEHLAEKTGVVKVVDPVQGLPPWRHVGPRGVLWCPWPPWATSGAFLAPVGTVTPLARSSFSTASTPGRSRRSWEQRVVKEALPVPGGHAGTLRPKSTPAESTGVAGVQA